MGDPDFDPDATVSSGLPVSYTSSVPSVATIESGMIHLVGAGTTIITAYQEGDANYNAADPVTQNLQVTNDPVSIISNGSDESGIREPRLTALPGIVQRSSVTPVSLVILSESPLSNITCAIYDALGNAVFKNTPSSRLFPDSYNRIIAGKWDLTNLSGRKVATGTYVAIVKFNDGDGKRTYLKAVIGVKE